MSDDSLFEFPNRPVTRDEALEICEEVPSFDHTAPLIRLADENDAVVGMYVGFGGGAHLFGFNPGDETWRSVHEIPA